MSGNEPMCNSDEDEFFGPITAREIELDWRRLLAEKNKNRSDVKNASSEPTSSTLKPELIAPDNNSSTTSVNGSLHDSLLKDKSIRFIDDDENHTDVDAVPIPGANKTNSFMSASMGCENVKGSTELNIVEMNNSGLEKTCLNKSGLVENANNALIMLQRVQGLTDQSMTEVTYFRSNETSVEESDLKRVENKVSIGPHTMEDTIDPNMAEVTDLGLNETSVKVPDLNKDENNASIGHHTMEDTIDQNMAEVTNLGLNETSVKVPDLNKDENNASFGPHTMEDTIDQNMAEVTNFGLNETSVKVPDLNKDENNASFGPHTMEDTLDQNMAEVTNLGLNETSVKVPDLNKDENNASIGHHTMEDTIDQNMAEVTKLGLNETSVKVPDLNKDENNASFGPHTMEDTLDQNMAEVTNLGLNETSVKVPDLNKDENNASIGHHTMEDTIDQNMAEVTNLGLNETSVKVPDLNKDENKVSIGPHTMEDTIDQNIAEVTNLGLNETSVKVPDLNKDENKVSIGPHTMEDTIDQNIAEVTNLGLNETSVKMYKLSDYDNNSLILPNELEGVIDHNTAEVTNLQFIEKSIGKMDLIVNENISAVPPGVEDVTDQIKAKITGLELNDTSVKKSDLSEDENNSSAVLCNIECAIDQNLTEVSNLSLNETSVRNLSLNEGNNALTVSHNLEYSTEQCMPDAIALGLNYSNFKRSDLVEEGNNTSAQPSNREGPIHQNSTKVTELENDTSVRRTNPVDECNASVMLHNLEDAIDQNVTEAEVPLKSETFGDKSIVSVKGENHYEVYIPISPSPMKSPYNSTFNQSFMEEKHFNEHTFADKTMISVKGDNRYEVYVPFSQMDYTVEATNGNNCSFMSTTGSELLVVDKTVIDLKNSEGINDSCSEIRLSQNDEQSSKLENSKIQHSFNERIHVCEVSQISESNKSLRNDVSKCSLLNESALEGSSLFITQENETNNENAKNLKNCKNLSFIFGSKKSLMETNLQEKCHEVSLSNSPSIQNNEEIDSEVKLDNVQKAELNFSGINLRENANTMDCSSLKNSSIHRSEETSMETSFHDTKVSHCEVPGLNDIIQPALVTQFDKDDTSRAGYDFIQKNESENKDETDFIHKGFENTPVKATPTCQKLSNSISKKFMKDENNSSDNESSFASANDDVAQASFNPNEIKPSPLNKINESSMQSDKFQGNFIEDDDMNAEVCKSVLLQNAQECSEIKSESGDSSEKSFVSLKSNEDKSEDKFVDGMLYVPPGKKQCIQSTPGKNQFIRSTPKKNKENEDPKSRIPIPSASRLPVLKPATLKLDNFVHSTPWASEFRRKKIPQPKKPDYVLSPGKLDRLIKSAPTNKQVRPHTAGSNSVRSTPIVPLQSRGRITSTPNISSQSSLNKSPSSLKALPNLTKKKAEGTVTLKTPPKNSKFMGITSPVAEYIKNPPSIIRNVTPSKEKPADISTGKNESMKMITNSPKPEVFISPKYYSSANKRVLQSSNVNKSPVLPKMGERQAAVFTATPKVQVLKHTGRVLSTTNDTRGEVVVVARPTRKTSLSNTSFADLPPSSDLDMSVVQKL